MIAAAPFRGPEKADDATYLRAIAAIQPNGLTGKSLRAVATEMVHWLTVLTRARSGFLYLVGEKQEFITPGDCTEFLEQAPSWFFYPAVTGSKADFTKIIFLGADLTEVCRQALKSGQAYRTDQVALLPIGCPGRVKALYGCLAPGRAFLADTFLERATPFLQTCAIALDALAVSGSLPAAARTGALPANTGSQAAGCPKSDLAVSATVLARQLASTTDAGAYLPLAAALSRLLCIVLLQETAQLPLGLRTGFEQYLEAWARAFCTAFGLEPGQIDLRADSVCINPEKALPCALLVNELVLHLLATAATEGQRVHVQCTSLADTCWLSVWADGQTQPGGPSDRATREMITDCLGQLAAHDLTTAHPSNWFCFEFQR